MKYYLTKLGLDHLIEGQSAGKNYFEVFCIFITIQLFYEQHFEKKV